MGFIIRSCNARPIQTGARSFAGGTNYIARCAAIFRRTRLLLVLPLIVTSMSSHWESFSHCRSLSSASGDCPMARFRNASSNRQKSSPSKCATRFLVNGVEPRTFIAPSSQLVNLDDETTSQKHNLPARCADCDPHRSGPPGDEISPGSTLDEKF